MANGKWRVELLLCRYESTRCFGELERGIRIAQEPDPASAPFPCVLISFCFGSLASQGFHEILDCVRGLEIWG